MRIASILTVCCGLLAGCASETNPAQLRHGKLLTMASAEAQQITDPTQRLTRQLRFAHDQIGANESTEGRKSLELARQTLEGAKPEDLKPRIRIAGWVSISEMSRGLKDDATANIACNKAVDTLRSLEPAADRTKFVVGVATEVRELQGKPVAAKLLTESAQWAKQIPVKWTQREALISIADASLDCDDYDGVLAVLRTDPDPAWRSDTLKNLGENHPVQIYSGVTRDWLSRTEDLSAPPSQREPDGSLERFSTPVDFDSVFAHDPPATQP